MSDDRVCDLKDACTCSCAIERHSCGHFHMPCPPMVTSKQDRLRTTKQTWDKRRDKMMREAERRLDKVKADKATEAKLYDVRRDPIKHLRKKGIRI